MNRRNDPPGVLPRAEPPVHRGGRGRGLHRYELARDPSALRLVLLLAHPVDARVGADRRAEPAVPAPRRARSPRRSPADRRPALHRCVRLALLRGVCGEHPGPRPLPSQRHGVQADRALSFHHVHPRRLPALRPDPGGERDLRVVPVRTGGRGDDRTAPQLTRRREGSQRTGPRARDAVRWGNPARTPRRPRCGLDLGDAGRIHSFAVQRRVHSRDHGGAVQGTRPRAECTRARRSVRPAARNPG